MRRHLSCCLFLLIASPCFSATFHVSTSGSDSDDGSQGSPWRTLQKAADDARAGDTVLAAGTPEGALDRSEGLRYLTRLLRAGLDSHVESADPRYPRFYQLANETIKIGNDNPDNVYHNANVSGAYEYRIIGNRGSVPYLTFGSKGGGYEKDGTMVPTGQLDLRNRRSILIAHRERGEA